MATRIGFGNGNGWDLGVTEGGSSGSALFDGNGRIIGQLLVETLHALELTIMEDMMSMVVL